MDFKIILLIGLALNVIGYSVSMLGYTIAGSITYGVGLIAAIVGVVKAPSGEGKNEGSVPTEPSPSDIKGRGVRRPGEEY
ncbi:MAG: hypothetical protein RQ838_05340 [Caldivirga sp.]|nr:hypothetical protein [Caldivirga sp.]